MLAESGVSLYEAANAGFVTVAPVSTVLPPVNELMANPGRMSSCVSWRKAYWDVLVSYTYTSDCAGVGAGAWMGTAQKEWASVPPPPPPPQAGTLTPSAASFADPAWIEAMIAATVTENWLGSKAAVSRPAQYPWHARKMAGTW